MNLSYIPLLQIQRDFYNLPRGFDRFQEYLRTMVDPNTGDLALPLVAMNPMGKEHLPVFLDKLLAMNADGEAARATADAQTTLQSEPGQYKVCLVVSDDLKGGWTNRATSEFGYRFEQKPFYKRSWIASLLWTSEWYEPKQIREEVLQCIFRVAYVQQHGYARTLGDMIAQEGYAMRSAGSTAPALDNDDLEYTRDLLASHLNATDHPTIIAGLFGDEVARQLGYTPLGLSPRAGFALALGKVNERA